jgi:acyl carrier protein
MKRADFLTRLGETLMAAAPLTAETRLDGLAGWDSMGKVEVLSLIDESLQAKLPRGSLGKCASVGDILALVNSHLTE